MIKFGSKSYFCVILVLSFVASNIAQGQTSDQFLTAGRTAFVDGDYRTAHSMFEQAHSKEKSNASVRFFMALTTLVSVIDDSEVQVALNAFGFQSIGRNPLNWAASAPADERGWPITPAGWASDKVLNLVFQNLSTGLGDAFSLLEGISNKDALIMLTAEETGSDIIFVDWGDVSLIKAGIMFLRSMISNLEAYNTKITLADVLALRDSLDIRVDNLLEAYPSALKLNSGKKFNQAEDRMLQAVQHYQAASLFIRGRLSGVQRLFTVNPEDFGLLDDWDRSASEISKSIKGTFVDPTLVADDVSVNLGNYYSSRFVPRNLLPDFDHNSFVPSTFPDVTFGNTIKGYGQVDLNSLFGRYVADEDFEPPTVIPTPPIITLIGDGQVTLSVGDTYIDFGATARDYTGDDLTPSIMISTNVNTSLAGIYRVTYDVTSPNGYAANQVSRTVVVEPAAQIDVNNPVIDSLTKLGEDFLVLGWENDPEKSYQIFRADSLSAPNWEKIAELPPLNDSRRSYVLPMNVSNKSQFIYVRTSP